MMYNDTTGKSGLLQSFEFWTRQPDGTVTGNAALKAIATVRFNEAFGRILPLLLAYNDQIRWDDTNNTDAPVGRVNLVANQHDYKITTDDNSLSILNVTHVRMLTSSTGTQFYELERITSDDPRVAEIISPSSGVTGVPTAFVELGNTIYLDVVPSYSATLGLELFFGRQQVVFTTSMTTEVPGIPLPFHELLSLYAAFDWNMVNRTDDTNLLTLIQNRIAKTESDLSTFIALRNPSRAKLTMACPPTFI